MSILHATFIHNMLGETNFQTITHIRPYHIIENVNYFRFMNYKIKGAISIFKLHPPEMFFQALLTT